MNRRSFLKTAAAFVAPTIIPASALGRGDKPAPSERVTIGLIGAGGKGLDLMGDFSHCKEAQFTAISDVDRRHLQKGKALAEKLYGEGCATHHDFRELCARKDLDAVVVATPDHWHALAALEAIRQKKDVYAEKPLTHLFREGQVLYREVAKTDRIFQVGSQQRSNPNFRIAAEMVMNGLIGKVKEVRTGLGGGESSDDDEKVAHEVPDHLDYDFWGGPSRKLPYHPERLHFKWRWALDYGGGNLMDWIGHHNDIAHWALGLDKSGPIKVEASGFRYPEKGIYDSPLDYTVRSEYEGGTTIVISAKGARGVRFYGEDGWVYADRRALDASNKDWIRKDADLGKVRAYRSPDHRRNFIDGVLTRKPCICPAEAGHRSITPGHLAYVSDALKRPLRWHAKTENVVDDAEADKMLKKVDYRGNWKLEV